MRRVTGHEWPTRHERLWSETKPVRWQLIPGATASFRTSEPDGALQLVSGVSRPTGADLLTPPWVLAGLVLAYVAVFGSLTWSQQSNFGTFGFDMGIHDQGIWLLSRFKEPYVTVVGRNYMGHHTNLISLLFVPLYWVGGGPHALYAVETIWMAVGAVPVWLLARDRLGNPWLGLVLAAAYLLYPSLEWINWWHFHPDALMITPLLFAYWLATRCRWRWFAVAVVAALLCKEDAALAIVGLGLVLVWQRQRRVGGLTAAVGVVWFILAVRVAIPAFNGGEQAFYESMFPTLGNDMGEIILNLARHPSRFLDLATLPERITYYRRLLIPVALAPLVALPMLLVGAPQMAINVSAGSLPTYDFRFHYSAAVVAAVFLATVEGCRRLGQRPALARFVVGVVGATSLASNVAWSPSPIGADYDTGIWARSSPRVAVLQAAVRSVPPDAGVSASYTLVPHLTHRVTIYEFPNPWIVTNWLDRRRQPEPARVDYLVLDLTLNTDRRVVADELIGSGEFETVSQRDQVLVARRRTL